MSAQDSYTHIINPAAWQAALKDVIAEPLPDPYPDAVTVKQYAAMVGLQYAAASNRLRQLLAGGRVEQITKHVKDDGGVARQVKAYRLLPAPVTQKSKKKGR